MAFGAITGTIEGAGEKVGKNIDHFYESDETNLWLRKSRIILLEE